MDFEKHLQRFGLRQFRPGQKDVIDALMSGDDCLCIMPTGGGKSLCYQLPSLLRDGVTLVVSPLIALMKDQVDSLLQVNVPATLINSTLTSAEQVERLGRLAAGEYKLVYVAPERFRSPRFLDAIRRLHISLLAVDEAHCISEWGHDFRPNYARLGRFRRGLGEPQTIALTATATPDVQKDIASQLGLSRPRVFVAGFARSNLHYEVRHCDKRKDKLRELKKFLQRRDEPGIVYSATRKSCQEVADTIREQRAISVGVYHAGLEVEERRKVQEAFMSGEVQLVVATNAFGMGIDKSDVRFVVHFQMPGTLEAYYQEAGRAGRDGDTSHCLLLYSPSDRYIQEFFIDSAYPPRDVIRQVYDYLRKRDDDPIEITQNDLKAELGLSIGGEGIGTCERLLEASGVLRRLEPNRNMAAVTIDSDVPTLQDFLPPKATTRRKVLGATEQIVGGQRHEIVYLQPRDVAQRSGLPMPTVARVLRELTSLEAFDYVPPFRGRAIHFIRRDVPFDELAIDYESLERRRAEDLRKLDQVARYANTSQCRQGEILRYFGEAGAGDCHHCDNCECPPLSANRQSAPIDATVRKALRIVLSGIARAQSRFGKTIIAAMLCGSKSAKIVRWKLDQLSTFGLLHDLTQSEVVDLIDELTTRGLVEQHEVNRFRPVVRLTEQGVMLMKGEIEVDSHVHVPRSVYYKMLSSFDAKPSSDSPNVTSTGDLGSATPTEGSYVPSPETNPEDLATFHWTWRLLDRGFTPRECALIRGLTDEIILEHALQSLKNGYQVKIEWFLNKNEMGVLSTSDPTLLASRDLHELSRLCGVRPQLVAWYLESRSNRSESTP